MPARDPASMSRVVGAAGALVAGVCCLGSGCVDAGSPAAAPRDAGRTTGDATVADAGPIVAPEPLSPNIVVDQFGYRTTDEKIAVVRSPVVGFDANTPFMPGATYALVDAHSGLAKVFEAMPAPWNGGGVDPSSGDQAWWFDFSSVTAPGDYYVLDETQRVRSDVFRISDDVYRDVLVQAMRMFYYQRDGIAKDAAHAGAEWADGPAHLGPDQDTQCALYTGGNAKDVHGGWWDAGDENKYTNPAASDVIQLLRAFRETPGAFSDDYNIPESGNGVPDILDETKWELDWMIRMQNADGSVLSIVGNHGPKGPDNGGSPNTAPSTDTSPCVYGPASTSATLSSAAGFALASIVFNSTPGANAAYPGYAADLANRAAQAWAWADANPSVVFMNSGIIGAGEQEVNDQVRLSKKVAAAGLLFELTGSATYRDFFDANYTSAQFVASGYVDFYAAEQQESLLEYTLAANATPAVVKAIVADYNGSNGSGVQSSNNLGSVQSNTDPYLAFLYNYLWGSNSNKARQGNVFTDIVTFGVNASLNAQAMRGAERYVHYIHGLNPLGLVYLSNMGDHGAIQSVTRFFHSWFAHGSNWDAVGVSTYAPPPGYLVGGPNPGYSWDSCCPSSCTGALLSCGASPFAPPTNQPSQKSYKDFNQGWPLDSWSISEPDVGYQANYVRLLSKFVD